MHTREHTAVYRYIFHTNKYRYTHIQTRNQTKRHEKILTKKELQKRDTQELQKMITKKDAKKYTRDTHKK